MELLLEEHQTLVQNHIQKIDSAFHRLQTLGREHAQTLVDEADEISGNPTIVSNVHFLTALG